MAKITKDYFELDDNYFNIRVNHLVDNTHSEVFNHGVNVKTNKLKYNVDDMCCEYCFKGLIEALFENEYINSAGIKKDINDFFDKATYKKLEPYEINELNSQNTGPDKIVFENLLKYLSELNYKQLYENRKIEKNDMFDSLFISYFPDFNIFTFDRKMRETFKNIAPIFYTELNNFIQTH